MYCFLQSILNAGHHRISSGSLEVYHGFACDYFTCSSTSSKVFLHFIPTFSMAKLDVTWALRNENGPYMCRPPSTSYITSQSLSSIYTTPFPCTLLSTKYQPFTQVGKVRLQSKLPTMLVGFTPLPSARENILLAIDQLRHLHNRNN
jgi:hypothetical protein